MYYMNGVKNMDLKLLEMFQNSGKTTVSNLGAVYTKGLNVWSMEKKGYVYNKLCGKNANAQKDPLQNLNKVFHEDV